MQPQCQLGIFLESHLDFLAKDGLTQRTVLNSVFLFFNLLKLNGIKKMRKDYQERKSCSRVHFSSYWVDFTLKDLHRTAYNVEMKEQRRHSCNIYQFTNNYRLPLSHQISKNNPIFVYCNNLMDISYFVRHFGKTSLYMETTSTSMLALTQINAMRSSRLYEWAALILAKGCFPYSDSCLLHSVCRGRGMQTHKCAYSLTIINIPKSDHQKAVLNSNISWIPSLSLIRSLNYETHLWTCFTKMRVQPFIRFHLSDGQKLKLLSCYRGSDNPQPARRRQSHTNSVTLSLYLRSIENTNFVTVCIYKELYSP